MASFPTEETLRRFHKMIPGAGYSVSLGQGFFYCERTRFEDGMSIPYVTIGGKEVSLTPGSVLLQNAPASGKSGAAPSERRTQNGRSGHTTAILGLLAALSLLILLGVWFGVCRKQAI